MDLQLPTQLPRAVVAWVLIACVLPFALGLVGVDLGVERGIDPSGIDAAYVALGGSFVHSLLEWSAFCAALACVALALVHYRLERDAVTPVIGLALFAAGCVDAVHTLAANRLIPSLADPSDVLAASWAISRVFNAGIMLFGAGIFLAWPRDRDRPGVRLVATAGAMFSMLAALVLMVVISAAQFPSTHDPDAFFKQPWDVVPLMLFLLSGAIVFPRFQARYRGVFTEALLLSIIPQVACQFHMIYGSRTHFDHHSNAAHLLKIVAYLVPFIGLCIDYINRIQLVRLQSDELRRTLGELGAMKLDREAILETTRDGICGLDEQGRATFANPAALRLLGQSSSTLRQRPFWELVRRDEGQSVAAELARGAPQESDEATFYRGDGTSFDAAFTAAAYQRRGAVSGAVVTFRDVTRRRARERAERERAAALEKLNRELTRINEELEQFTYVASHDLKAPLRAVGTLAEWIEEDLNEGNREEVQKHLTLMRGRVKRMETLLADLLKFARIGRDAAELQEVETGALVRELADLIDPPEGIEVVVAEGMPTLFTPVAPLEHIFLNLIGNAIKHHDQERGRITVSCDDEDAQGPLVTFRVADDGPGIPAAYRRKVFRVFQTLRPRDEVESSGMGLAIVKKIIQSANGEIRLEDVEPRGVAFVFTWPRIWQVRTVAETLSELPDFYSPDFDR